MSEETGKLSGEQQADIHDGVQAGIDQAKAAKAPVVGWEPTSAQLRSLVDVLSADLRRTVKIKLKPADAELLARVGRRAVQLAIEIRATPEHVSGVQLAAFDRRRKQVESQLKAIRSIGSSLSAKRFWGLVDAVIDRMFKIALTAL